jgi:ankyrin repeat protein
VASGVKRPLKVLAYYGDLPAAETLLQEHPELAEDSEALSMAAGKGNMEIVRLLLRYRPGLAKTISITKPRAAAALLIEHGMDPNRPNWMRITPLHHAAGEGDIDQATFLLDHGADLNAREEEYGSTPPAGQQ